MLSLTRVKKIQADLDQLDLKIAELLAERLVLSHELLIIKDHEDLDLIDPIEEAKLIEKVGATPAIPEHQVAIMRTFKALLDWCLKSYQKQKESGKDQGDEFLH